MDKMTHVNGKHPQQPIFARLYTTLGCHLCEEALGQLQTLQASGLPLEIECIDIATAVNAEELISEYGVRIPVVAVEGKAGEIGWPFSLDQLREFLVS